MTSYPKSAAHGLWRSSHGGSSETESQRRAAGRAPTGRGRALRTRAGGKWLAHALLIFVPAMFLAGLAGLGHQPTGVVIAVSDTSVEVALP